VPAFLVAMAASVAATAAVAAPRERTALTYHCEKKAADGAYVDALSVTSRRACKKSGGRWVKGHDAAHAQPAATPKPTPEPSAEPSPEPAPEDDAEP
jgi:hypothetical protein